MAKNRKSSAFSNGTNRERVGDTFTRIVLSRARGSVSISAAPTPDRCSSESESATFSRTSPSRPYSPHAERLDLPSSFLLPPLPTSPAYRWQGRRVRLSRRELSYALTTRRGIHSPG